MGGTAAAGRPGFWAAAWRSTWLRVAVSALLLGGLALKVDVRQAFGFVRRCDPFYLSLALAVGVVQTFVSAWRWHTLMPLLVAFCGYMPAKRFGWMEDTPKGVARDWARMGPRFERSLRPNRTATNTGLLVRRFGSVSAPILALGLTDDPFGTPAAIDRLLDRCLLNFRPHAAALAYLAIARPSPPENA